jgi:transposase
LHDELTAAGFECHVLAPTKMARSTQRKRQKTDDKDAEDILQLLRGHVLAGNPLPKVWIPDAQTRDDRERVRARLDAAEKAVVIKTQIQCLLKRNRLTRPEHLKSAWTKKSAAWLRMVTRDPAVGSGVRTALASLLRQWEFLEQEIERLEEALDDLVRSPRYAAAVSELVQLQGVGLLTALVFLTEIGDSAPLCQSASNQRLPGPGAAQLRERGSRGSQRAHHPARSLARATDIVPGRVASRSRRRR